MSWTKAIDTITAEIRRRNMSTAGLEELARRISMTDHTQEEGIVGAALERLLRERYTAELSEMDNAAILAETAAMPDEYPDRPARARQDARTRLLEEVRFPGAPDPIETFDAAQGLSYGQHIAAHYRLVLNDMRDGA